MGTTKDDNDPDSADGACTIIGSIIFDAYNYSHDDGISEHD